MIIYSAHNFTHDITHAKISQDQNSPKQGHDIPLLHDGFIKEISLSSSKEGHDNKLLSVHSLLPPIPFSLLLWSLYLLKIQSLEEVWILRVLPY